MDIKLPYGLKNGKLVHISEVERGLSCNCICPHCESPLNAKKGNRNTHHFAHVNEDCKYAFETTLHIFVKEILYKYKKIMLPEVSLQSTKVFNHVIEDKRIIEFDNVELEKRIDNIIPDVVIYKNNKPLIVEIAVTHKVDEEKLKKIKELGISTIEIDLKDYKIGFENKFIEDLILYNTEKKKWLNNEKANRFRNESINRLYLFAKKTLDKHKGIRFPEVTISYKDRTKIIYDYDRVLYFDKVEIDKKLDDIVVDVVAYKRDEPIIIQFLVDDNDGYTEKIKMIKKLGISILEIDLRGYEIGFLDSEIENTILLSAKNKKWILNIKANKARKDFIEKTKKEEAQLRKRKEERIQKEKEMEKKREVYKLIKEKRVRKLLNKEYQDVMKKKFAEQLHNDPLWIHSSKILGIKNISDIPSFLNQEIEGEFVFNCDRRAWQSRIFAAYIHKRRERFEKTFPISVKSTVNWIKKKGNNFLPINYPLVYLKDVKGYKNYPGLAEVISDFLFGLEKYGFVRCIKYASNPYYNMFKVLNRDFNSKYINLIKLRESEYDGKNIYLDLLTEKETIDIPYNKEVVRIFDDSEIIVKGNKLIHDKTGEILYSEE